MFATCLDTSLLSGRFVDRDGDGADDFPEVSERDIRNYLGGDWHLLTRRQVALLREAEEDPDGVRWKRAHAHEIYCSPDWLFEVLFVNFPASESWEESYQALRRLVGPEPLDYVNVTLAISPVPDHS